MGHRRARGARPSTRKVESDRERIQALEDALRPFTRFTHEIMPDGSADDDSGIFVPAEGDVYLYVGKAPELGLRPSPLHTDDFERARIVMINR